MFVADVLGPVEQQIFEPPKCQYLRKSSYLIFPSSTQSIVSLPAKFLWFVVSQCPSSSPKS